MATNSLITVNQPVRVTSATGNATNVRASVARPCLTSKSAAFLAGRACGLTSTSGAQTGRGQLQCFAKGKSLGRKIPGKGDRSMGGNMSMPPLDPENPQFMIYVRSKAIPMWQALSVVTGGSAAKGLVSMSKGGMGSKFGTDALTRNVGSVIYKDEQQIKNLVFKTYPLLKNAKVLEWGYKTLDPDEDAKKQVMSSKDVILVPPKGEIKAPGEKAVDALKSFAKFASPGGDKTPEAPKDAK
eukprot:CAMPEP_0198209204 /NCGR_PEP_ID=MMETSP1445-20131203/13923_1 /TAXON_ID=36898 /ORGANISM="Pyramimonas sp., Strain CCMP2087" /LENGTH=240 /DNA_ID=CAMNT_0043882893 /DNA_START=45 /DNA_END=767 /DNA_ORIENTATION=-